MRDLARGLDDERLLLLGQGEDHGVAWELWLHQSELRSGWHPLLFRWPGGGSGDGTPLRAGAGLAGTRGVGELDPRRGLVYLKGEIGKQFNSVHVDFGDGTTKDAVLLRQPDLPVNFYVVLADKRPTKLVAVLLGGGSEWIDDPMSNNVLSEDQ